MQRLLVRNVGLRKPSKCHLILESFYISAPVAAQSFIPRQEFAVSIVHILINTVRPNRGNMLKLHKHNPRTSHEQEMVKRALGRAPRMIRSSPRMGGLIVSCTSCMG